MDLSFERAAGSDPMDARATITLLVVSIALSVLRFQGSDLEVLISDWESMPENAWSLFTSTLLHGGWLHLIFNVFWTFRFGVLIEAMLGTVATVLLFLFLGVGSSAAQWAFSGPGVGLSGIFFGLFGLLWALGRWHPACRGILDRRVIEMLAAWFLLCIILGWYDIWPIANAAHAGGALFGGLLGWALAVRRGRRLARSGVVLATFLAIALFATVLRPTVNRSRYYSYELFERALAAGEARDHERSAELYLDVIGRGREEFLPGAWNNLGIAYSELGRRTEAREAFDRSKALTAEGVGAD